MHFKKPLFFLSFISCILLSSSALASYIDNDDGTVTDTDTGLMWQKATAPGTYTWEQALLYCENLNLGGYRDWRLPTVKELGSILDFTRYKPAINISYFPERGCRNLLVIYFLTSYPDASMVVSIFYSIRG